MLSLVLALVTLHNQTEESVTVSESPCYAMIQTGDQVTTTQVPGLYVIESTARDGPFRADLPAETAAILCRRSSIIPAPNDWKVLEAGFPLYIVEAGASSSGSRVGVLEVSAGQVRFRLTRGEFREGESEPLRRRLNQLQESARQ